MPASAAKRFARVSNTTVKFLYWRKTPVFGSWAYRFEAKRPDGIEAVVIVTPNHLHAPVARAFLEAGIDVICDKPLSTTMTEAEELAALRRESER